MTIARVTKAKRGGAVADLIASFGGKKLGAVDHTTVVLFESRMQPGGTTYVPLAELPIGGAS